MIPQDFINDLLERVDIVEQIQARVPLKKRGNSYLACCPFHQEKSPSFHVSRPKQLYHCFGCGASGNVVSFLMTFERLDFPDAIEALARDAGVEVPHTVSKHTPEQQRQLEDLTAVMAKVNAFYRYSLTQTSAGQPARDYCEQRGLSADTIERFQLGYAPAGWESLTPLLKKYPSLKTGCLKTGMLGQKSSGQGVYPPFRDRLMFPIHNRKGQIVAFGGRALDDQEPKYYNSPETPIFHKSYELYGLYQAQQARINLDTLFIVEGYMDVIKLSQAGIGNVVATLGTAINHDHIKRLFRTSHHLIFCFDGDKAGRKAAWRALESTLAFMRDGKLAQFMFLPEGEDPDSFVHAHGANEFLQQAKAAKSGADFLYDELCQQSPPTSVEGKAKLGTLIKPLLAQIPSGIFQTLMTQRFAERLKIDPQHLLNPPSHSKKTVAPPAKPSSIGPSTLRRALTLLVQHPELAAHITEPALLGDSTPKGGQLIMQLIDYIKNTPNISPAMILEKWRDHSFGQSLTKLAMLPLEVPASGIAPEFQDILRNLEKQRHAQKIEALMQKANSGTLTPDERESLRELIQKKHGD